VCCRSIQAYDGGRVVVATSDGVCTSNNGGTTYSCHKVKELTTPGRYASAPSADVIYLSAGMWPAQPPSAATTELSANLRITNRTFEGVMKNGAGHHHHAPRLSIEMGGAKRHLADTSNKDDPPSTGYSAQLLKSTDGGKTWGTPQAAPLSHTQCPPTA